MNFTSSPPLLLGDHPLCAKLATSTVNITPKNVRQLVRLLHDKAAGPDGVSPRVIKACAVQLCRVFLHIFKMLLMFPVMWKTSRIVLVPKTQRPCDSKDFRPAALTSHITRTVNATPPVRLTWVRNSRRCRWIPPRLCHGLWANRQTTVYVPVILCESQGLQKKDCPFVLLTTASLSSSH